jgi:glucose-1-phosphate thymidylyltransferase
MNNSDLIGVILAAGRGSRMFPFNLKTPKPLLPICNKPLLEYQIEAMVRLGIRKVLIVIGHLGFELSRQLGDGSRFGASIEYYEQERILGIAHAVGQLEPRVNSPFLLLLGDIYFEFSNLGNMLEEMQRKQAAAVLAVREELDPAAIRKNFVVIENEAGYVRRVIEKPRYAKSTLKGCGLYLFDLPIFDAIRRTPRSAMRDEYEITDSIQILIDDDFRVAASRCVSYDMNLTFPGDLLECNLRRMSSTHVQNVIDHQATVHPGASLRGAVVGRDAEIENPVTITDTVVFPHSKVVSTHHLDRMIITPDNVIDCRSFEAIRGTGARAYPAAVSG